MTQTVTVRRGREADIAAILDINLRGVPGVARLDATTLGRLLAAEAYLVVAERHGRVVGYLVGYTHSDDDVGTEFEWFKQRHARFLYVDQVGVSPGCRRLGVGTSLYAKASRYAAAADIDVITCDVNLEPVNQPSLDFHERLGFERVGQLRLPDGRLAALLVSSARFIEAGGRFVN